MRSSISASEHASAMSPFQQQAPRCHQLIYMYTMASQCIYIKPESLQHHSFHLGASTAAVHHRDPNEGIKLYISYQHLCRSLSSIRYGSPHPSTKATNGTIDTCIAISSLHVGTVPFIYRSTAAISRSRNTPFLLLPSIAVPQAIKLHQPWSPKTTSSSCRGHERASAMLTL